MGAVERIDLLPCFPQLLFSNISNLNQLGYFNKLRQNAAKRSVCQSLQWLRLYFSLPSRIATLVLQVVFKFFFSPQTEKNREIVRRSGLLLWQLLMAPVDQISPEIQKEVCLAIR